MENKLSCSAVGCVHNLNALCAANTIHVTGTSAHSSEDTMCHTFAQKGFVNAISNALNMNLFGEIRQVFTNSELVMNPNIVCDAISCRYNHYRHCDAHNVVIHGPDAESSSSTQCETFME